MSEFWSTWYQPLIGALHVLGIAWFGGSLFVDAPTTQSVSLSTMRRIGIVWMLVTGLALLALNYAHVLHSVAFHIKVAVLVALIFVRRPHWLTISLWIAVIFASRLIAYF